MPTSTLLCAYIKTQERKLCAHVKDSLVFRVSEDAPMYERISYTCTCILHWQCFMRLLFISIFYFNSNVFTLTFDILSLWLKKAHRQTMTISPNYTYYEELLSSCQGRHNMSFEDRMLTVYVLFICCPFQGHHHCNTIIIVSSSYAIYFVFIWMKTNIRTSHCHQANENVSLEP